MTKSWHLILGHVSEAGLKELSKQGLVGKIQIGTMDICEHCTYGKATRFLL